MSTQNPRVACAVCGRTLPNNVIERHGRSHDAALQEAKRQRKCDRQRAYNQTEAGRTVARRTRHSEQGRRANIERHRRWFQTPTGRAATRAHNAVRAAIQRGRIVKKPCAVCGLLEAFAHHPNGYEGQARWDITWLCLVHHMEAHGRVVAA
jgi:hypothetical protein